MEKPSYAKINQIVKTLPISYYLGYRVNVELSNTEETSYYDIMNDKIVISYNQLPLHHIECEEDIEKFVRCMLYHEISHAMLTPKDLFKSLKPTKLNRDILNIFEDQRIETLLKHTFLNVDFESFVKKVNDFDAAKDTPSKTAIQEFYKVVRFGVGDKRFIDRRDYIIFSYRDRMDDPYTVNSYGYDVKSLYDSIAKRFELEEEAQQEISKNEEKMNELKSVINNINDMLSSGSASEEEQKEMESALAMANEKLEGLTNLTNEMKDALNSIVESKVDESELAETEKSVYTRELERITTRMEEQIKKQPMVNSQIESKVKMIIENATRKKRGNASCSYGYSGKIDPRMVNKIGQQENYRWFAKQQNNAMNGNFTNYKLNLFCDMSGSFCTSINKINEIIHALHNLEKTIPNFSFDLIQMNNINVVRDKSDLIAVASGGNKLDRTIKDCFDKVNKSNQCCYNLVVFDGDAWSDCYSDPGQDIKDSCKVFNNINTIIISDYANQKNFDKYSPNARRIYTINYVEELEQNVLKALGLLFR